MGPWFAVFAVLQSFAAWRMTAVTREMKGRRVVEDGEGEVKDMRG